MRCGAERRSPHGATVAKIVLAPLSPVVLARGREETVNRCCGVVVVVRLFLVRVVVVSITIKQLDSGRREDCLARLDCDRTMLSSDFVSGDDAVRSYFW